MSDAENEPSFCNKKIIGRWIWIDSDIHPCTSYLHHAPNKLFTTTFPKKIDYLPCDNERESLR